MKAKNLLITYLTFVFCCFATYATADDISEGISDYLLAVLGAFLYVV